MGSGSQKVFAAVKSYSKRGQLLSRQDFQAFAEARDLDEMATRLRGAGTGGYATALADVPKPYTAQAIESALRGRLAEVHYSISKATGGSKVLRAYYMKFPIWNLKLILKSKVLGKAQDEIEPLLNLRAEELLKQRDMVLRRSWQRISRRPYRGCRARCTAQTWQRRPPCTPSRATYRCLTRTLTRYGSGS